MRKLLLFCFAVLFLIGQIWAQKAISGKIVDEKGDAIANVSITAKGTSAGTTSDALGMYNFTVPDNARELELSSIGFVTKTVLISGKSVINITLSTEASELATVVVTGYSRIKKSEYVGAASKIDKSQIELVPIGSFDQMLQGRAPGLRVSAGSGQPGASASVQIRGPKSISGGTAPLYVIDGVPVEAAVFQSLNPNDFESVDVIKDAAAAALYGSRGAAGIIVVTTKRGRAGKTRLTYRPQLGFTQPGTQPFAMMNSTEILQFHELLGAQIPGISLPGWAFSRKNPANASLPPSTLTQYDRTLDSLRGINTNWRDVFQRQGSFTSHDLNLSGGSENTRFFTSAGVYSEDGIGERSSMDRYTIRFNLDHKTDKLNFQLNTTVGYTERSFIESENGIALANPFAAAYLGLPYHKLYKPDGSIDVGSGRTGPNAFQRIRDIQRYNNQVKTTNSISVNYNFTENIYVGGNAGADFRETNTTTFVKPNTWTTSVSSFPGSTGSYAEGYARYFQSTSRAYAGYKRTINDKHSFDVNVNAEYLMQKTKNFNFTGYGLNVKLPNTPAAITPGTINNQLLPIVGGSKSERTIVSFFGTLKYNYDDKYFFDFTARRDGTSILPEQNRFANFFAGGLLWNALKENFTQNWDLFTTLRVRASYGSSANAENFPFGDFGYFPLYGPGSYAGLSTLIPTTPGNPVGNWEYTDKANVGIEFGMMKERLTGEVNVYNEITRNLFIQQNIDPSNGGAFTSAQVNAGEMRNRGIELNLNYDIVRNRNLTWSAGGNFGYNKNEILDLGQEKEYPSGTAIIRVGLPLGSHYINKWAGVDASTGRPLYFDINGKITDQYNSEDQVADFGTFYAPWTGGFNTSVRYKGFELSAFFNFQAEFSRFNNQDFFQLNHAFALQGFNLRREMLTMWSKPGDITDIQSGLFQRQFSSKDIQDASYLRFRNLQLAYTIPSDLIKRTKSISALRVYVQGQNLYTWTNWTGFDPEDNNNIAGYEYPVPRTFTFGLDITF
jgi:TonB-linked SusC/RagA family outer membrane protein